MSTSLPIGRVSASPAAGRAARLPGSFGVSSLMIATSWVSNPGSPCAQPKHQSGSSVTVPRVNVVGGPDSYETKAGMVGSKQCAAVKNTVGDSADPEQTNTNP